MKINAKCGQKGAITAFTNVCVDLQIRAMWNDKTHPQIVSKKMG